MADAIAVLNAGSSSIKFSIFVMRGSALELELHGQVEGIYTTPHFIAKRNDGTTAEKSWAKARSWTRSTLEYLIPFTTSTLTSTGPLDEPAMQNRCPTRLDGRARARSAEMESGIQVCLRVPACAFGPGLLCGRPSFLFAMNRRRVDPSTWPCSSSSSALPRITKIRTYAG